MMTDKEAPAIKINVTVNEVIWMDALYHFLI